MHELLPLFHINYKVADEHSKLFQFGKSSGKNAHDIIIAATVITYDMKIVTRNVDDFTGIPGLAGITETSEL